MRQRSPCWCCVSLLAALVLAPAPQARADEKAEAALKQLNERFDDPKADREKVRQQLLTLHRTHPGTPQALGAARLLAQLPSPLDRLDPKVIPELERFTWQPKELVALLGEHRGRQGGTVNGVAFSPDCRFIASGGSGGYVRLWDPTTMRLHALLHHGAAVNAVAFDAASKRLAAAGNNGIVRLWEVSGPVPQAGTSIKVSTAPLNAVAFSPDGKKLATACSDTFAYLHDVSTPEPKETPPLAGHTREVTAVVFSPRGGTLFTGSHDGTVRLWDLTGERPVERTTFEAHKKGVTALALDPEGRTLATAGLDGQVGLWLLDGAKPRERARFKAHDGAARAVAFSPGGKTLATGGNDRVAKVWDVSRTEPKPTAVCEAQRGPYDGHIAPVTAVVFDPKRAMLVTGSTDWTTRLWSLGVKPTQQTVTRGHLSYLYTTAFTSDGLTLASGSLDGSTRLWVLTGTEPKERSLLRGDGQEIYALTFAPDGKTLASGGSGTTFRLWDAAAGRELRKFEGHPARILGLEFAPDGRHILCTSGKELWLWNAQDAARVVRRFEGHEVPINGASLSPDGKRALSGSGTYELDRFGRPLRKDDKYVYRDSTLRVWDVESGKELHAVKHPTPFARLAFTPDGRGLSSDWDGAFQLWDLAGGEPREARSLRATPGYVRLLTPSPDGTRAATVSTNNVLVVWDLESGKSLQEWRLPEIIGGLAFASDSRHLAVTFGTGVINILRLAPPKMP